MKRAALSVWLFVFVCASLSAQVVPMTWPPMNWQPQYPVPEFQSYTVPPALVCQTVPNPATLATIGCNIAMITPTPAAFKIFARVHEYGHVNQIRTNPALLYSPYVEIDADCFAAENLVQTDPGALQGAILVFWSAGQQGDPLHGTGFQRAARALQCARTVVPNFAVPGLPIADAQFPNEDLQVASLAPVLPEGMQAHQPATGAGHDNLAMSKGEKASVRDQVIDSKGAPPTCLALDILIDSAARKFWEASTTTGAIRPTLESAIGGKCTALAGRERVDCTASADSLMRVSECLNPSEWKKACEDTGCTERTYVHPGDAAGHASVVIRDRAQLLEILAGRDEHVVATSSAAGTAGKNAK